MAGISRSSPPECYDRECSIGPTDVATLTTSSKMRSNRCASRGAREVTTLEHDAAALATGEAADQFIVVNGCFQAGVYGASLNVSLGRRFNLLLAFLKAAEVNSRAFNSSICANARSGLSFFSIKV